MKNKNMSFKINKTLHSTFGEYFGKVIYDGVWVGKDSDVPNVNGIRKDVIDGCIEAGVKAFRWPGGCCADHYHWMDGIGEERYDRLHFMKEKYFRNWCNDFGTDEFLELCELTGMEPFITANVATGTVDEFLSWFEYCNGDTKTKYGALRAKNGHPEPYNVKVWAIGNTDENAWHRTNKANGGWEPYAYDYLKFTKCTIHPDYFPGGIEYVGLGMSIRHNMRGWTEGCLDIITDNQTRSGPDLLSVHHYLGGMKDRRCGLSVDYSDEEYEYTLDSLKKYQEDIDYHREVIKNHTNPKYPTGLSFDEWGLWHPEATMESDQNQRQTMRDAIFAAMALHIFYKNADIVKYAMITQISNLLHSLFETKGKEFYKTPTFYVFKLFKEHLEQYLLDIDYTISGGKGEMLASMSEDDSRVVITMINRDICNDAVFEIRDDLSQYKTVSSEILTAENLRDENTFDDPYKICSKPFTPFADSVTLPCHSIVRMVLEK